MELFLVAEGTSAVGLMAIVFTVGLLGVGFLGWYVVKCDAENRHAERDLLVAEGHPELRPVETHAVADHGDAPAEVIAVEPVAPLEASPTPPRRQRKGH